MTATVPGVQDDGVRTGGVRTTRAWVRQIMGLPVSVHVRAADPARPDIARAVDVVFADLDEVDAVFFLWRPDSHLTRIRSGALDVAAAHPSVATVRALCERATAVTGGLFTTDLIGPDGTRGWDPTGLVKGWAVERAAARLAAVRGIGFSINAGGDIVCGRGPGSGLLDPAWRIGVEQPARRRELATVVTLTDCALATSGTAARGHHIVDPRTGAAVETTRSSVTVTGPSLTWTDVWATACFVDPRALEAAGPDWRDYRLVSVTG